MKDCDDPNQGAKRDQYPGMREIRAVLRKHPMSRKQYWSLLKKVTLPPRPKDGYAQKGW